MRLIFYLKLPVTVSNPGLSPSVAKFNFIGSLVKKTEEYLP